MPRKKQPTTINLSEDDRAKLKNEILEQYAQTLSLIQSIRAVGLTKQDFDSLFGDDEDFEQRRRQIDSQVTSLLAEEARKSLFALVAGIRDSSGNYIIKPRFDAVEWVLDRFGVSVGMVPDTSSTERPEWLDYLSTPPNEKLGGE